MNLAAHWEFLIWILSASTIAAVIMRPFRWPEWPWAVLGAAAVVSLGLETPARAIAALGKGVDVYLFLVGMMALSELAREEGLFEWLAKVLSKHSRGSSARLFFFVYAAGILVTAFLSNDATAVVLTPAVYHTVRRAGAKPLPYLFACALVANAASFLLPISNPANLVVYASQLPPLAAWIRSFFLPSLFSIICTYLVLCRWFRDDLRWRLESAEESSPMHLPGGALVVLAGLCSTVAILLVCSSLRFDLGAPTFIASVLVTAVVSARKRRLPVEIVKNISWSVLPLVGGLFVLVEALNDTRLAGWVQGFFRSASSLAALPGKELAAFGVALASNLANNLPVGLLAGSGVQANGISPEIQRAVLIGVDLGPNLSVTGSLATILWLVAIRREGESVNGGEFLKLGLVIMPASLLGAILLS